MRPTLRFATFNLAMSADSPGQVFCELQGSQTARFQRLAAIIQHCNPDVLLFCEFDHPGEGGDDGMLACFQREYLEKPQLGGEPVFYPHTLLPPTNTGLALFEGQDITGSPENAQGFGRHHGQYGFVLLSKYPIDVQNLRSWQTLLWKDFPGNQMPLDYYSEAEQAIRRLSSKNHIAVPISIGDRQVTVVACHPTPPVFDGPEKRNVKRNADEIRLLGEIIQNAPHLVDDNGKQGGLAPDMPFVVMGDLNADPANGDGDKSAIAALLSADNLLPVKPASQGAPPHLRRTRIRSKSLATHNRGLRLDYVLPSSHLNVVESGVFWPNVETPLASLVYDEKHRLRATYSSDHRLVWVDFEFNASASG
nr:endonuclease/exonuclease/phosphatase family protein [Enterovibrio paralichthyis]